MHTAIDQRPGLGRLVSIDFRDRNFAIERPIELPEARLKYYFTAAALNQGQTSQCVAYSGEQFLLSGRTTNKPYKTPGELYTECQRIDEWPGESPTYEGTSVRALMKILKGAGLISEYNWAFDVMTVVNYLLTEGPVVVGTDWYDSMFDTDAEGFCRILPGSRVAGGHAYLLCGVNRDKLCYDRTMGAFRLINSWGRDFGQNGRAWLSFTDMDKLLSRWGEAAVAKEIKFRPSGTIFEAEAA